MKKYIWLIFIILSGVFILLTTLVEIFSDVTFYPSVSRTLTLIIASIVCGFFSAHYGYRHDQESKHYKFNWEIFVPIITVVGSLLVYAIYKNEIPIYFAKISLGFSLLFYSYWKITGKKSSNSHRVFISGK